MSSKSPAAVRVRSLVVSAFVTLALGGIPGAPFREVVRDVTAPPVPVDVADRDGEVDVTVRTAGDEKPVEGAHVQALAIIDAYAYLADSRTTDGRGLARLVALPHAETWILVDAAGKARRSTRLVVAQGARSVDVDLEPEHTFDVAVRDDAGQPVSGAEIEIDEPGDPLPIGARADLDGSAHVVRLAGGPWTVTTRAAGYEDGHTRARSDGETATVTMRRLGGLDVHVDDDAGHGVGAAKVEIAGANLWPPRAAVTNGAGDVRVGGLGAGNYALRATAGDAVSPIELGVDLARGETRSVVLRLGPGRFANVIVTDGDADDADTVPDARVTLAEGGLSSFPIEATTDRKGHVHLGPYAPGPVTLSAQADGFVARADVAVADPPPGETRIALSRAGALTGHVVDSRGYPVDGASIEIVGSTTDGQPIFDEPERAGFRRSHFDAMLSGAPAMVPMGELGVMAGPVPPIPLYGAPSPVAPLVGPASLEEPWVTRDDGTFRATPASPGRIRAIVHHPEFVEAESDVVTLLPGGEAHVEIVMHAGGTLEGTVVDSHDNPVAGARVTVAALRGTLERMARTGTDGTFAFAAMPDVVSLTVGVDDDDSQPPARQVVTIPEGQRQEVTVRLPEASDPLPVTVVDDRDWPVDAAQVSASSLSPGVPLRTTAFTDKDGTTKLKRAGGVPLRVEVSAPGHASKVVTTAGNETELHVALDPAQAVTGEVVTARGRDAVSGAEVTLFSDSGARRARTNTDGDFSIDGLAAGPATLRVRASGTAPFERSIVIPADSNRDPFELPRIELVEEGRIEGSVVDAGGAPVVGARVARDSVPTWLTLGSTPRGVAVTDGQGRFALGELPEGSLVVEAYAPDLGRARVSDVKVVSGRTTTGVTIILGRTSDAEGPSGDRGASGNVAVTLGETAAPVEVVIVSVVEGSEAERAGLAPGDVVKAVDGAPVSSMKDARARLAGPAADDVVVSVRRGDQAIKLRVAREPVRR